MKKIIYVIIINVLYLPISTFAEEKTVYGADGASVGTATVGSDGKMSNFQPAPNCESCAALRDQYNGALYGGKGPDTPGQGGVDQTTNGQGNNSLGTDDLGVGGASAGGDRGSNSSASKTMTVIVTEEIPGGDCKCIATEYDKANDNRDAKDIRNGSPSPTKVACGNPATRKYSCTVKTGLAGFQATFAELIRYSIYIVMLLGVLGIVGLGIAWAFAGGDDVKAKTTLKTWGVNIVIGLTILFLFTYILRFLAPWIFQ